MKASLKIILLVGLVVALAAGCTKQIKETGFLSDYSRLEPFDDGLRYGDTERLAAYDKFILDPVVVQIHGESGPDAETRRELANYMHDVVVKALQDQYMIAAQPGPGVARLRIAITDIEKSNPVLNAIPQTKLTGVGLGGASMEGELLDSQTGEQIGAVIQTQKGKRLSLAGLSKWGDAKSVMDDWAKRFRARLDEAHGNASK